MSITCDDTAVFFPNELEEWDNGYRYQSGKVSPGFREAVKAACPFPFTGTPDAKFCLCLLQYLMFPTLFQEKTTRIVIPCRTLAVLDNVAWTSNYRAIDRLHLFEKQTGIALDIGTWNYHRGLARTVQPAWPAALEAARVEELGQFARQQSRVYFDTGEPYGRSQRATQERLDYALLRCRQATLLPDDHPQRKVLELLNRQSDVVLRKIIRRNLSATCQYVSGMPAETPGQRLSQEWAMAVLDAVSLECRMAYRAVQKTARVYTIGPTLHQLPREARKLLLAGCTTLDLKAAQLAIAARVWDVPLLLDRLQRPENYWQVLLNELQLGSEHKPALKTATYALLFGKSLFGKNTRRFNKGGGSGVVYDLAQDLGGDTQAHEAARRFADHPITVCLMAARQRRMKQIVDEGGLVTVFEKNISVPANGKMKPGSPVYQASLRSALAEEMQAYEQKLMLPALEIIAQRRGITVLSYLHDGLTLHFEDKSKKSPAISRICWEVNKQADLYGIPTSMDEE